MIRRLLTFLAFLCISIAAAAIDQGYTNFKSSTNYNGVQMLVSSSPATITASQNNYNWGNQPIVRSSATKALNITGFLAGNSGASFTIFNVSTNIITLVANSTNSSSANRIAVSTTASLAILPADARSLWYDGTSALWRIRDGAVGGGSSGGGGGGSGVSVYPATATIKAAVGLDIFMSPAGLAVSTGVMNVDSTLSPGFFLNPLSAEFNEANLTSDRWVISTIPGVNTQATTRFIKLTANVNNANALADGVALYVWTRDTGPLNNLVLEGGESRVTGQGIAPAYIGHRTLGQWISNGTVLGTTSPVVGAEVGVQITDSFGVGISTGKKYVIYGDPALGHGSAGNSYFIFSLDTDPSYFNGTLWTNAGVKASTIEVTNGINSMNYETENGTFTILNPSGYDMRYESIDGVTKVYAHTGPTTYETWLYDGSGVNTHQWGLESSGFVVNVVTATGSNVFPVNRLTIGTDVPEMDFNALNRGFKLQESTITFFDGSQTILWGNSNYIEFTPAIKSQYATFTTSMTVASMTVTGTTAFSAPVSMSSLTVTGSGISANTIRSTGIINAANMFVTGTSTFTASVAMSSLTVMGSGITANTLTATGTIHLGGILTNLNGTYANTETSASGGTYSSIIVGSVANYTVSQATNGTGSNMLYGNLDGNHVWFSHANLSNVGVGQVGYAVGMHGADESGMFGVIDSTNPTAINLFQYSSTYVGNILSFRAETAYQNQLYPGGPTAAYSGAFNGNFIYYSKRDVNKFVVDNFGNVYASSGITGSSLTISGIAVFGATITTVGLAASTGTFTQVNINSTNADPFHSKTTNSNLGSFESTSNQNPTLNLIGSDRSVAIRPGTTGSNYLADSGGGYESWNNGSGTNNNSYKMFSSNAGTYYGALGVDSSLNIVVTQNDTTKLIILSTTTNVGGALFAPSVTASSAVISGVIFLQSTMTATNIVVNTATGTTLTFANITAGTSFTASTTTINGKAMIQGTTTNDVARLGDYGEYLSSQAVVGSSLTTTSTYQNIVSTIVTPGDWDCVGMGYYKVGSAASAGQVSLALSIFSANTTTDHVNGYNVANAIAPGSFYDAFLVVPRFRVSVAASTTVYLKEYGTMVSGNMLGSGTLSCRRMR